MYLPIFQNQYRTIVSLSNYKTIQRFILFFLTTSQVISFETEQKQWRMFNHLTDLLVKMNDFTRQCTEQAQQCTASSIHGMSYINAEYNIKKGT